MKWNEISYAKLQLPPEPLARGLSPPDPRSFCPQLNLLSSPPRKKILGTPLPLSSTEFVEPPPKKIPGYATDWNWYNNNTGILMCGSSVNYLLGSTAVHPATWYLGPWKAVVYSPLWKSQNLLVPVVQTATLPRSILSLTAEYSPPSTTGRRHLTSFLKPNVEQAHK